MAQGLPTLPAESLSLPSKREPVFTLPQADRASCLHCFCSVGDPSSRVELSPSFKAQILIKKKKFCTKRLDSELNDCFEQGN